MLNHVTLCLTGYDTVLSCRERDRFLFGVVKTIPVFRFELVTARAARHDHKADAASVTLSVFLLYQPIVRRTPFSVCYPE